MSVGLSNNFHERKSDEHRVHLLVHPLVVVGRREIAYKNESNVFARQKEIKCHEKRAERDEFSFTFQL